LSARTNPITNHKQVRTLALAVANERAARIYQTPVHFTRVSQAFLDAVDADVRALIERRAREHWQKGVTLT
jgi:hypothetical protein